MSYRNRIPVLCAAAIVLAGGSAHAEKWEFAPTIAVGGTYNDNYFLDFAPTPKTDVAGAEADVELLFRNIGPRTEFEIAPRVNSTFFPDESQAESNEYFLSTSWLHRTQRSTLRFRGDYSHESVVESELLEELTDVDLGETIGGGGERISVQNERDLIWLRPAYTFQWTERTRLELEGRMYQVDYDEAVGGQVPFTDLGATVGLAFRTSPVSQVTVRATASNFSPDTASPDTDRLGAEVQWSSDRSQTTRLYVRGGVRRAEFGGAQSATATGFVGGLGGSWRREVSRVLIDVLRSVEPSSVGRVVNRDELRVRLERALSPRTSTFARLQGVRTETSVDELVGDSLSGRKYLEAQLGFEWRFRRQLSLVGEYGYRWQEYEVDAENAAANSVALKLVYEPKRRE